MNRNVNKRLKNFDIVIASHIYATGPALDLEEFLKKRVKRMTFIGHPFSYARGRRSFYRQYRKGRLVKRGFSMYVPAPLVYVRDFILTLWWGLLHKGKIDLFIGSDNSLAFLGLILKLLGKAEGVVLYTIDYSPRRFKNPVLNRLYHFFDGVCLKRCDVVWNVSDRIEDARKKYSGMGGKGCARQIVVPLGMWFKRIPRQSFAKRERYQLVFLGHLLKKQGLQMVIRAMPRILSELPKVRLVVIGDGPYKKNLESLSRKLGVSEKIEFLGYLVDHKKVEEILAKSTIGLATYKPSKDSFTYFADPGKIKTYLGAGLPVVVTDVPQIARLLDKKKSGVLTKYGNASIAESIVKLLGDMNVLGSYAGNATKYASRFDWERIFEQAFAATWEKSQ